jgi:hypothetical protein
MDKLSKADIEPGLYAFLFEDIDEILSKLKNSTIQTILLFFNKIILCL